MFLYSFQPLMFILWSPNCWHVPSSSSSVVLLLLSGHFSSLWAGVQWAGRPWLSLASCGLVVMQIWKRARGESWNQSSSTWLREVNITSSSWQSGEPERGWCLEKGEEQKKSEECLWKHLSETPSGFTAERGSCLPKCLWQRNALLQHQASQQTSSLCRLLMIWVE